ncbi:hypothetical protein [Dactylosporangium sp. CA-139066]|uniref:hypothetical protein n=1 Tax=Dactylosporangium sp. CA-139066 TaxID=3239930 RepID=UPI003D933E0F
MAALLFTASCARSEPKEVLYYPEYQHFDTAKDLFGRATLVLEGRVTEKSRTAEVGTMAPADPRDPKQNPLAGAPGNAGKGPKAQPVVVTVHSVQVVKVYKGHAGVGQEIEVKELGGALDGVSYREVEGPPPLRAGTTYVLFLETYPDAPASLLNSSQAKFEVGSSGDLVSRPENDISLSRGELGTLAKN